MISGPTSEVLHVFLNVFGLAVVHSADFHQPLSVLLLIQQPIHPFNVVGEDPLIVVMEPLDPVLEAGESQRAFGHWFTVLQFVIIKLI